MRELIDTMALKTSLSLLNILVLFNLTSCGMIRLGSSAAANDPAPTGQIRGQGTFSSLSGATVTGTAVIYLLVTGEVVLRLNGITTPSETGLKIIVVIDGNEISPISLRNNSGSQNYTLSGITYASRFDQVLIRSSRNVDYGQALLR